MDQVVPATSFAPAIIPAAERPRTSGTPKAQQLPALTSLRFFAAALIVFTHTLGYFGTTRTLIGPLVLTQGVSFFFILSGFLMMYVYPSLDVRGAARFVVARIARIWPMSVLAYILAFLLLPASLFPPAAYHPDAWLTNLALVQNWYPHTPNSLNNVSWILSIELFFYLCFPFILWRWRQLWPLKFVLLLLPMLMSFVVFNTYSWSAPLIAHHPHLTFALFQSPLPFLGEFALGMVAATLWRVARPRLVLARWQATLLEAIVLVSVGISMYYSTDWAHRLGAIHWIGPQGATWLEQVYVPAIPFAALIFVMALDQGWGARLLRWAPLVVLGEISYSLYLTHNTFAAYWLAHPGSFTWIPKPLMYPAYWALILIASYIFWRVVEVPCRRIIVNLWDRLLPRRTRSRPDTSTDGTLAELITQAVANQ